MFIVGRHPDPPVSSPRERTLIRKNVGLKRTVNDNESPSSCLSPQNTEVQVNVYVTSFGEPGPVPS